MTSASTSSKTAVSESAPPKAGQDPTHPGIQQLPQKQPPVLNQQAVLHGQEPGQIVPIVTQAALAQIDAHSRSDTRIELGGALLGRAYRHEGRVYVNIEAALPAVSADHGPIHFTFNADTWSQLRQDREQKYPNLEIVGWFHTHPNLGVFYSGDDVVVHSAAFTLPWHTGLVIDPVRQEACFFGWDQGELAPFAGFYELLDAQETPFVNWRVPPTTVWADTSEAELAQSRQQTPAPEPTTVYAPPTPKPTFNPGIGLIVGSIGLLLALLMLFGWVLPLSQDVNQLEDVVLLMADEALADTNAAACPDPRLRMLTPILGDRYQVGATIDVVGTASHPDADSFRVEQRLAGADNWTLLNSLRRSTKLDELAAWETTDSLPGLYELRLTAVDRNNIRLANTTRCEITIELLP